VVVVCLVFVFGQRFVYFVCVWFICVVKLSERCVVKLLPLVAKFLICFAH